MYFSLCGLQCNCFSDTVINIIIIICMLNFSFITCTNVSFVNVSFVTEKTERNCKKVLFY